MLKSVNEAHRLDTENGNTLWWDAICKEIKNIRITFEEYNGNIDKLIGYQHIDCYMMFDIKIGKNFR